MKEFQRTGGMTCGNVISTQPIRKDGGSLYGKIKSDTLLHQNLLANKLIKNKHAGDCVITQVLVKSVLSGIESIQFFVRSWGIKYHLHARCSTWIIYRGRYSDQYLIKILFAAWKKNHRPNCKTVDENN